MSETRNIDEEAIAAWIEQQRDRVRQFSMAGRDDKLGDDLSALGERWLDVAKAWLNALTQYAQHDPSARPDFVFSEELLGAWHAAWTTGYAARESATEHFADLMRRLPPVGLAREQTEAWRELAEARLECQKLEQELKSVLARVQSDALVLLEAKVREREQGAQSIASFRDLYDLWVDCGEEVFARVAHSDSYGRLQAELGNATMRFRARQQKVIEHGIRQMDLPTRSELNSVHRQLRELRAALAADRGGDGKPHTETRKPRKEARAARPRKSVAKRPKRNRR